ncbi:SAM-dependent methyltransferase [Alphaproteobacteria bacterium]|nr:SAM-dependent methyltransferase [Alphaproteobacteria bacterium]
MLTLRDHLIEEIKASGPISLETFMTRALTDPAHGYYIHRQPFGRPSTGGGDFTTAPEISQMFGELIGAWCADLWHRMGQPERFCLAELGPGRGTLMADVLRAASVLPEFSAAVQVHFVEISPALRKLQAERVPEAIWHGELTSLPDLPMIVLANEFFDALPIQQFRKSNDGWHEIKVGQQQNALCFVDGPPMDTAQLPKQSLPDVAPGDIIETCAASHAVVKALADKLQAKGGAALIMDYGYRQAAAGDSFQALHQHQFVEPLDAPGQADLTAHVNFQSLQESAIQSGLVSSPITHQGDFLSALGLDIRARSLMQAAPEKAGQIGSERDRLAAPDQMGHLFKVLAIASPDCPPLAGFAQ